jgi:hypothetical protein
VSHTSWTSPRIWVADEGGGDSQALQHATRVPADAPVRGVAEPGVGEQPARIGKGLAEVGREGHDLGAGEPRVELGGVRQQGDFPARRRELDPAGGGAAQPGEDHQ